MFPRDGRLAKTFLGTRFARQCTAFASISPTTRTSCPTYIYFPGLRRSASAVQPRSSIAELVTAVQVQERVVPEGRARSVRPPSPHTIGIRLFSRHSLAATTRGPDGRSAGGSLFRIVVHARVTST